MDHFMVKLCSDEKLVQRCLLLVVDLVVSKQIKPADLETLPKNLKQSLLNIFSKRGYLTDDNIDVFLRDSSRSLELSECLALTDVALEKISAKCKYLVKIDLNSLHTPRTLITGMGVSKLARNCNNLQTIFLRRCEQVDDACIQSIAQYCPRLNALNISQCPLVTDKSLVALGRNCRLLKSINFSGTQITDFGMISLFSAPNIAETIEEIQMSNCQNVTDESIECILMNVKRLKYLLFHSCPSITESSRNALADYMTSNVDQKMKHLTWTIY